MLGGGAVTGGRPRTPKPLRVRRRTPGACYVAPVFLVVLSAASYFAARATMTSTARDSGLVGPELDKLYCDLEDSTGMLPKLESYREARYALINRGRDLIGAGSPRNGRS